MIKLANIIKKIPKYNPDVKALSPENRSFIMFSAISVVVSAGILAFWVSSGDEVEKKQVALDGLNVNVQGTNADSTVSPLYKESIRKLNEESYNEASKKASGASMPIVYHDKPDTQFQSIEGCGCTFDENAKQALIEELKKLGVTGISKKDGLRLGKSDIYVQGDGTLIDESGKPYLWKGEKVKTDDKGAVLMSSSNMPIATSDGQTIYLSNEGKFYNESTAVVRLMGRLLSNDGVIVLGSGVKANRPNAMEQVNSTDVYVTTEAQLATMDARPIYHSSKFVFKDLESRLHNHYGDDLIWEDKSVFQQSDGTITDRTSNKFNRIGVLISHGGILIDNNSMLTEDLNDIKRFGESDLFVNSEDYLVDSFGENTTYLGYFIRVGANNSLMSEIGPVLNSSNSEVFLKDSGRFFASKPVYVTGTIKDSLGVAFDRYGHRITRRGKLAQLGTSIIWHTPDRYLATADGQPLQYNNNDTFQDISRFKVINGVDSYGLKTFKNKIIKDLLGNEVFLNNDGHLILENGEPVKESGILTTSSGVLVTAQGGLIVGGSELKPVVDEFGNQVYLDGKKVFKGADGKLYDQNGNVLTSADGRSLMLSPDGVLTDTQGNIVPSSILSTLEPINNNGGFTTDASGLVLDKHGKPILYKGKKVYKGSDGRLYDEDGNVIKGENGKPLRLNKDGVIVDSNGNPASVEDFATKNDIVSLSPLANDGFSVAENGEVLDENGNSLYYKGSKVFKGKDGKLYNKDGELLLDDSGRPLSLKNGQIVDYTGEPVDMEGFESAVDGVLFDAISENNGFTVDPSGQVLDKNGNVLYHNGKKVRLGADGLLYDEDGKLLTDEYGQPLKLNSKGEIVDSNGNLANLKEFKVGKPNVTMKPVTENQGFTVGKTGQVLDKDGNPLYFNGKKVYQGEDGKLYDEAGNLVTDANGEPLKLNSKGEIVTSNGAKADMTGFEIATPSSELKALGNAGFKKAADGTLLDANGESVYYKGKKVKVGPDGRLYDEDGKLLTDEYGQPLKLNSKGEIVDSTGKPASLSGFQIKDTNGELKPLGNAGFKKAADGTLLDANGESVYYKGKKVKVGPDGRLYDEDGKLLTDEYGQPLKLNSKGEIVDSTGKPASLSGFQIKDTNGVLKQLGNAGFKKAADGTLLDANGESVYYKGKKVKVGPDGRLYDEDGKLLTDEYGQPLKLNSKGEIVDSTGKPASLTGFQVKSSSGKLKPLANAGFKKAADGTLLDANGESVYYKGKKVRVGPDGRLYDEDGKLLTDENGQPLKLNSKGEIVDSTGKLASLSGFQVKSSSGKLKPLANSGFKKAADGTLLDANGESVYYKGKKVKVGPDGRLYDEDGKLLTDENGQPLKLNSKGEIVDSTGKLASLKGFKTGVLNKSLMPLNNEGFKEDRSGFLVDKNGNQLFYKGKKVKVGPDGRLYDEDGQLLTDANGKPLALNDDGTIVDADGKPVSMENFKVAKAENGKRFKTESSNTLSELGDTGIYQTDDGLLLDKNGKPITYKGKRVRRGKDGKLYDGNGQLILDELGRPLYMDDDGVIRDVNGNEASGVHFQNGDGQYLSKSEGSPKVRRLGMSDMYITRDGLVTDDQGRPILHNGEPVKIGAGGRLMTSDGEFITDANGNAVLLTNDGELTNREGQPSKGGILQDADGVTIDSKGLRVTNGGKLTDLGNGLYKTEEGLLVDRKGKPVLIDGEQTFVNADGEIVDANGRNVRLKGKRLYISESGQLLDGLGNKIQSNSQSVKLTGKGLTREDGTLISAPIEEEEVANVTNPALRKELENAQKEEDKQSNEDVSIEDIDNVGAVDDTELAEAKFGLAKVIDISQLSDEEIIRLNRRYTNIYNTIESKLTKYGSEFDAKPNSSTAVFSQNEAQDLDTSDSNNTTQLASQSGKPMNAIANEQGKILMKQKAGTVLYAANKMTVNTDLETKVVFDIMGLPHTHPLYRSTAHGTVSLKYDNVVIQYNAICPEVGECYSIDGIAVDPVTKSASINGDIDKHYWYRFGGLTLATLAQGAGMAIAESKERTEVYDEQGKAVTYSGLEGTELLVRAAEPVGEALAGVFMENVNRPYTGTIANGEEVGIFLFEDIELRERVKK
ncbi:hypothetical protein [Pseudoalteromonas nigrifaciens]|uniref:hypothetical protein n=1 Tax=Pseudoalteromonas nigrifaciens TaxID=28109 RepID=UPI003FD31C6E